MNIKKLKNLAEDTNAFTTSPVIFPLLMLIIASVVVSFLNPTLRSITLSLPTQIIKYILFNIVLFLAARQDLKEMKAHNWYSVTIFGIGLIGPTLDSVIGAIVCFVIFLLVYLIRKNKLGGADVKLVAACGFVLGTIPTLFALLIGLSVSLIIESIVTLIKKNGFNHSYPLLPYIAGGCLAMTIILTLKGFNISWN